LFLGGARDEVKGHMFMMFDIKRHSFTCFARTDVNIRATPTKAAEAA